MTKFLLTNVPEEFLKCNEVTIFPVIYAYIYILNSSLIKLLCLV